MNPALEETIYLDFPTQNTAGAPTNADSTPGVQVYENGVSLGLALTVTNITTGLYQVAIPCTAATGFEAGKSYGAYATAAIGGASVSALLENWQMRTGSADAVNVAKINNVGQGTPGTAGNLFIAGSNAATTVNFTGSLSGSVGSISGVTFPTNFGLLGIAIDGKISGVVLVDTLTTYTGNTVQTGDSFARIGANGSGLTSLAQASIWTTTVAGRIDVALSTLGTAANLATANASLVKIQAADYDTVSVTGDTLTLSNGATQVVTASGRVTT